MMENNREFFNNFYFMKLQNRIKFFLLIWNQGIFRDELEKELVLQKNESVTKYTQNIEKMNFLTIEKGINPYTRQKDDYYFISEENFKNIFLHICKKAKINFNQEAYELALNERINIYSILDEKLQIKLNSNELMLKELLIELLNKNLAFFFLYIMRLSNTIKNNEYFNQLTMRLSEDHPIDTEQFILNLHKFDYILIPYFI